jgi:hypothetical protein
MKLCKDCKHFDARSDCTRWQIVEPVRGETRTPWIIASVEREVNTHNPGCNTPDPCGPDGKHWVKAPPPPPPAPVATPWWRRILCLG